MAHPTPHDLETDPRFPSGKWAGYFLMPHTKNQRHQMELCLTFRHGAMTGSGRDVVGEFVIAGLYAVDSGKCEWKKTYVRQHDVFYEGFNEGKGIWGMWHIPNDLGVPWRGGFHIWPEGMGDPSGDELEEEATAPEEKEVTVGVEELELVPQ